jgi:hypothetical protein
MTKIIKIISGFQSGGDFGTTLAAVELGIPTGGHIPANYRTEYGSTPSRKQYGAICTTARNYQVRTKLNVQNSDITLIFGDHTSPGCSLTKRYCRELDKPYLLITNFDEADMVHCSVYLHQRMHGDIVVNGAGNRQSSFPGIEEKTKEFCINLFSKVNNLED